MDINPSEKENYKRILKLEKKVLELEKSKNEIIQTLIDFGIKLQRFMNSCDEHENKIDEVIKSFLRIEEVK